MPPIRRRRIPFPTAPHPIADERLGPRSAAVRMQPRTCRPIDRRPITAAAPLERVLLLIFVGAGAMLGRILAVDSVDPIGLEDSSFRKSRATGREAANAQGAGLPGRGATAGTGPHREGIDAAGPPAAARSSAATTAAAGAPSGRWSKTTCACRRPYAIDEVIQQPNWDTIDMVKHDGHLYSSKPPLLSDADGRRVLADLSLSPARRWARTPTRSAASCWSLFNLVPLLIYFCCWPALVERLGTTDWGRIFVMAAAVFGTFLTTFAVTINNHLPAAVCAIAAVYAAVRIWFDGERRAALFHRRRPVRCAGGRRTNSPPRRCWPRWRWCCSGRPRGRRCLGFAPAVLRGGRRLLRHQLDRPSAV